MVREFFEASTWDEALTLLTARRSELLLESAKSDFLRILHRYGLSDASAQVLELYLHLMQKAVRDGPSQVFNFLLNSGPIPKLTLDAIDRIAAVHDSASARRFATAEPEIWRYLLLRVLYGSPFWMFLLGEARVVKRPGSFTASTAVKTTVVLDEPIGKRRIFKILPISDGGLSVTVPYHNARAGCMLKMPLTETQTGAFNVDAGAMVNFSASDHVKLSYHSDGFVQFSSERHGSILSGRNRESGEPRGLGLISHPLSEPIQTGPSIGCSIWGLSDFSFWKPRKGEAALQFSIPTDYYDEPETQHEAGFGAASDGYAFSIFVFPTNVLENAVGPVATEDELDMKLPMNIYHRDAFFRVKLAYMSESVVAGVIAKPQKFYFHCASGFQLSGPGDGKHNMSAIYPAVQLKDPISLDYRTQESEKI